MKIDGRLKQQYFKNLHNLNDVYVWKEEDKTYKVGINGTSHHKRDLTKGQAEGMVTMLVFQRNKFLKPAIL